MPLRSRRVLIVTYHFPPEPTAGALRPSFLAKYLNDFGWEPTILTRSLGREVVEPSNVVAAEDLLERIGIKRRPAVGAPTSLEKRAMPASGPSVAVKEFAKSVILFPDRAAGWLPVALAHALRITGRKHFDAIISSCPPLSAHIVASLTAMRRRLPWIADYRDLWSGNPYFDGDMRTRITCALEYWFLRRATMITGVNDSIASRQRTAFKKRSEAIPAAYDPADWDGIGNGYPRAFTLSYAGILYEGERRLDIAFSSVAALRKAGEPAGMAAQFEVYGGDDLLVRETAKRLGLSEVVKSPGSVERSEVLRAERSAAILLLPLSMRPGTAQDVGSKIFEYIGARRPIIAIGPPDSAVRQIIAKHGLGWFVSDEPSCAKALREAYARYMSGELGPTSATTDEIATAREVAGRFAALLDSVAPNLKVTETR
jgi:glycosyltransferase involved in cell wall biosynthesis